MNNINQTIAVALRSFPVFSNAMVGPIRVALYGKLRKYIYTSQENQTHFAIYNVVFTTNV